MRIVRRALAVALAVVAMVAGYGTVVHAHAVLVHSSIADHPVVPDAAVSVTLRFNAGVEAALSKVVLLSAKREERPLTVTAGTSKGEMTVDVPALSPGLYGLKYRVMAADGHLTDGVLRFTVAAPH